ncbi:glycosyltransferase family 2 protein [Alteromonas halophila]|uniref:Glycosyltransferase 2-like domain-containing protein n=1 Tax=Alteromonas halophila TaxID=516698 RepID=A0A918JNK6_9ALTE|nr:glycosyltransferase [Alteromonas halophila]GGW92522.1 hypothetical protein GCM10007391_28630 [Alteromonas halophila]
MKKVKSLVKKILGRPERSPLTVDTVSQTTGGYCVIGWYFTDGVKSVAIEDENGNAVDVKRSPIPRDDVKAATGRGGTGFQLLCNTDKELSQLKLVAHLSNGRQEKRSLALQGQDPGLESETGNVASNIVTQTGVKGSCEYAIVSPNFIFVSGWLTDGQNATDWSLVDGRGFVVADVEDITRYHRRDVVETYGESDMFKHTGFALLMKVDTRVGKNSNLTLCATLNENSIKLPIEHVYAASDDPMTNAMRLLNNWQSHVPKQLSKASVFGPMLREIYPGDKTASVTRIDFGQAPECPRASMIIPLYGRYDFLRYQLSYFGRRPQYQDIEILYVIDDPKIAGNALKLAREMEYVSQQPFSLLQLSHNVGFGKANNIGAEHATADTLLLVNSDILPKSDDWLDKMLESVSREDTGIVGARLLFEDDTLQHDGMAPMTITEYPGLLFNDHPRKGWMKSLSPFPAEEAECELLTAACWAVKKTDFNAVGGFDSAYVLGDFEDSDLCLKLLEQGKKNVIRRDAELYHLERQSQNLVSPGRWKHNITILNAVLFNERWKDTLQSMHEERVK